MRVVIAAIPRKEAEKLWLGDLGRLLEVGEKLSCTVLVLTTSKLQAFLDPTAPR